LLVDAGITASRPAITEALARISPDPVRYLVNTHWHFDHTDGNEWFHSSGAEIVGHENTRKHLSTTTRVDVWDFTFPPAPEGAHPFPGREKHPHHPGPRLLRRSARPGGI